MGTSMSTADLDRALRNAGQEHLAEYLGQLPPKSRESLSAQLAGVDLAHIPDLVARYVLAKPAGIPGGNIEPVQAYSSDAAAGKRRWDRAAYAQKGRDLVRAGKVAAFTVAGGQGTRLGFDGPKGCYPAGAVTGKPLFACLADWILAAQERWAAPGRPIPWYIMTSPLNHAPTVDFFRQNDFFGLNERDVMFFPQGVLPSFDMASGRMLLDSPDSLAVNPDGHGGSLRALSTSGAIADMRQRGVEHISYTQIDNPLVRVIDPAFLGLHAFARDSSGEMSSKMVRKAHAGEKVGVLCRVDGRTAVIEYSDMPEAMAKQTGADGGLVFDAGSIAIHIISVGFVERLNAGGRLSLPLHRAEKKVPYCDPQTGKRVEPTKPNAVKLETFVFDALPLAERSIVLESERIDEFAPIKNADGADSPATCREIQTRRAAAWIEAAGWKVPHSAGGEPDCVIEVSPRRAWDATEVDRLGPARAIAKGEQVAL